MPLGLVRNLGLQTYNIELAIISHLECAVYHCINVIRVGCVAIQDQINGLLGYLNCLHGHCNGLRAKCKSFKFTEYITLVA